MERYSPRAFSYSPFASKRAPCSTRGSAAKDEEKPISTAKVNMEADAKKLLTMLANLEKECGSPKSTTAQKRPKKNVFHFKTHAANYVSFRYTQYRHFRSKSQKAPCAQVFESKKLANARQKVQNKPKEAKNQKKSGFGMEFALKGTNNKGPLWANVLTMGEKKGRPQK